MKVRFLVENVNLDFLRFLLASSSPSVSSSLSPSSSVSLSVVPLPSLSELSITAGVGDVVEESVGVTETYGFRAAVGAISLTLEPGTEVGVTATLKLEVLSMICAYRPSINVPTTLDS